MKTLIPLQHILCPQCSSQGSLFEEAKIFIIQDEGELRRDPQTQIWKLHHKPQTLSPGESDSESSIVLCNQCDFQHHGPLRELLEGKYHPQDNLDRLYAMLDGARDRLRRKNRPRRAIQEINPQ